MQMHKIINKTLTYKAPPTHTNTSASRSPSSKQEFRDDINGLRAWAVAAVVLYHFGVSGFSGGFIGVDVFFVISGYLMTRIIVTGLEGKRFDLWQFYLARAKRIVPALIAVSAVLLIMGWFVLLPLDYRQLATHTIASLLFFSNFKYWSEAGYFDSASHEKWLLHTWSLSVEWQFYLLLPLLLWVLWHWRANTRTLVISLSCLLIASLLSSILVTSWDPSAAFYLLPTRAWEMLSGGLVFLLTREHKPSAAMARVLEGLGLAMVAGSIVLFSANTPWPGAGALLPVAGSALVLMAARSGSVWTGNRITQWLGNNSYSVYLWHWPCVVMLAYLEKLTDPPAIALAISCSLILGEMSYRCVESPLRNWRSAWKPGLATPSLLFSMAVILAAPAILIRESYGIPARSSAAIEQIEQGALDMNPRRKECMTSVLPLPECRYGTGKLHVIVAGDSHAGSVVRSVEDSLPDQRGTVLDWSMNGCPTARGVQHKFRPCHEFIEHILNRHKTIEQHVPLIIVNRTAQAAYGRNEEATPEPNVSFPPHHAAIGTSVHLAAYRAALIETACEFAKLRPVYLLRPLPEMGRDVPKLAARQLMWSGNMPDISISLEEYHQRQAFAWEAQDAAREQCGVKILDPLPYLCWNGHCHGIKDGHSLYYDDDHLSEYGAHLLRPMFAEVFKEQTRVAR